MTSFIINVSQRLGYIMQYKSLSVRQLAEMSGVSISQIYKILSSSCDTRIKTLLRLIKCLNVSSTLFFDFSLPIESVFCENVTPDPSKTLEILISNLKIKQRNLARLRGLTQSKIAENLSLVDYKYIGYLLNGKNNNHINMKISTLYKLSEELGLEKEVHLLFQSK